MTWVTDPGASRSGDSTCAPPTPRSRSRATTSFSRRTEVFGGPANRGNRRRSAPVSPWASTGPGITLSLPLRNGRPDIHFTNPERRQEGVDDDWVEIRRRPFDDDVLCLEGRHGFAIRAVAGQ